MTESQRKAMEQALAFCEAWPGYGGIEAADALRNALKEDNEVIFDKAEPAPVQKPAKKLWSYATANPATVIVPLDWLEAAEKEIQLVRNAALEEAAKHCQACSSPPPGETQTDGQFAALHLAQQIRSLKS